MEIRLGSNEYLIYGFQKEGSHVIPPHYQPDHFVGESILWILPQDKTGNARMLQGGKYSVEKAGGYIRVSFEEEYQEQVFSGRPCCDFFGNQISFDMEHKELFERTFAGFYWDNLLNQMAERTFMQEREDIREGYVLSTLNINAYPGTYPSVDHEFHMKGRFAIGGKVEAELIKRMLQLQLKIMREDEMQVSRNVCSVQPDGRREYEVLRECESLKYEAQMFRLTGNIEFVEGVYNYYSLTRDVSFIRENLEALEYNCTYIEQFIRENGLLDSHVYYEDQVIKDGTVLQAQLFAANAFRLMGEIEKLLLREEKAAYYLEIAGSLGEAAMRPYPDGFWDEKEKRFIDWIDARGEKHDHIHLLSNELPVLFGFADQTQTEQCEQLILKNRKIFDLFPTFVAVDVEKYTEDEIGTGGPYDLCAAGRYWCWDAEYLAYQKDSSRILKQLLQVCKQAEMDDFWMGERYDMNYVYYNTGEDGLKNWHGASQYYEYPNVWIYVMICIYAGVRAGFEANLIIDPLFEEGSITLEQYGIFFSVEKFCVKEIRNIGDREIKIEVPGYQEQIILKAGEHKIWEDVRK